MSVTACSKSELVIIRFANQSAVFQNDDIWCARNNNDNDIRLNEKENITRWIQQKVKEKWGLEPDVYYIDDRFRKASRIKPNKHLIFEIHPRMRGGSFLNTIGKFIFSAFNAIFKPIVAPLAGIANAFLMLVKGVLYIIMLFMWFLKFCAWFFTEVLPSIPADIFGMVRFISAMLIDAVFGTIGYYFRKLFNSAGSTVVGAALTGWDNNPDESATNSAQTQKVGTADELAETKKQQNENNNQPGLADKMDCAGRKCYKTEAGTVPWTVILATVLFPPSGVFMELGLHGWIQILVCLLLTFMFYFPGLIYALIILYC